MTLKSLHSEYPPFVKVTFLPPHVLRSKFADLADFAHLPSPGDA